MTAIKHVLIAGAGLSGPALALSLARQGIKSTIFEIRPSPSESGGSITLTSRALSALDNPIGVYNDLKEIGWSYSMMGAYSDEGYRFGEISIGSQTEGGYAALRIMRHRLQKVLLDKCQDSGGMIEILWGKEFTKIEETDDAVRVTFTDGTQIEGDCLIGCDGIHSKIRSYVVPHDTPTASFNGQCTINGFVPSSLITLPPSYPSSFFLFSPNGILMVLPIDKEGETLTWGITTSTTERSRPEWKEYEESGKALRDAKAMYADNQSEPLRTVLDAAKETEAKVWPHHSLPIVPHWSRGRVCLMGDAAHALPPNGQGTALAFEDAAFMSRLLSSKEALGKGFDKLFNHFEVNRRNQVEVIRKGARSSETIKSKSGPWVWWVKQWAFWAFFTWKGGKVQFGHDGEYSVMTESIEIE